MVFLRHSDARQAYVNRLIQDIRFPSTVCRDRTGGVTTGRMRRWGLCRHVKGDHEISLEQLMIDIWKIEFPCGVELCKPNLYMLMKQAEYYPFDTAYSVGSIAIPGHTREQLRTKVENYFNIQELAKGKCACKGKNVIATKIYRDFKVSWVLIVNEYAGPRIRERGKTEDDFLTGYYGLQVWYKHYVSEDGVWKVWKDVYMYGFNFRWEKPKKSQDEINDIEAGEWSSRSSRSLSLWSLTRSIKTEVNSNLGLDRKNDAEAFRTEEATYTKDHKAWVHQMRTWEKQYGEQYRKQQETLGTGDNATEPGVTDSERDLTSSAAPSATQSTASIQPPPDEPEAPTQRKRKNISRLRALREARTMRSLAPSSSRRTASTLWPGTLSRSVLSSLVSNATENTNVAVMSGGSG
jgi:hypothetical protein